jgi:hypothetical protein
MQNNEVIFLDKSLFIGKGVYKKVYYHPEDSNLCIKISFDSSQDFDTREELRYRRVCKKRVEQSSLLTKYFGTIETNLGTGHVFELVRDYDGKVSETLESLVSREKDISKIYELLQKFKKTFFEELIITGQLAPFNLLIQRISEQESRIRIVDDIGMHRVLIPLTFFSKTLIRRREKKIWHNFVQLMHDKYGIKIE